MILIDTNLLIYAYHSNSPHHEAARGWLEAVFSGTEPAGAAWVSILAFLRISTDPRMPGGIRQIDQVIAIVGDWLMLPNFRLVSPGPRHWEILSGLLNESQAGGPLATDAHLAALAIEHGATLSTTDRDFRRFSGLRLD